MNGSILKIALLLILAMPPWQSAVAAPSGTFVEDSQDPVGQRAGMQENLVEAMPEQDQDEQQDHGFSSPRIIVPENLRELPLIDVLSPDQQAAEDEEKGQDPEPLLVEMKESLEEQLDEEQNLDQTADAERLDFIEQPDKLMDLSRLPLTYIQEHVPFLTKRNIIFFGRLELDYAKYSSGVLEDDSGFLLRRFRVGLAGQVKFWPDWNYKLEFDLTDGENTLSDAYLSWHSSRWGTFRIGNQKVAQTLSGQTSSVSIPFMERPLPVLAFTLKRRLGLGYEIHRKKLGANVTVFSRDPNEDVGSDGYAARFYFNPARSQFHVLHIGGSWMQISTDDDARFRARPESHKTDIRLVDTGVAPDVGTGSALGLELAGARGPVTFRSEFYRADWTRGNSDNPQFSGWYAEASWFLTGEQAYYREGKFIRPNIFGVRGALELALRFSTLDLNDQDIEGGTQENLSFGVNWYSQIHWRFMGNLIKVRSDGPYGEQNPWIVQFRAQYYF
jgi:phosphate-selective porin OprO/OprP